MVRFTGQDELLQRILRVLEINLGLVRSAILLVDSEEEHLIAGAVLGADEHAKPSSVKWSGPPTPSCRSRCASKRLRAP